MKQQAARRFFLLLLTVIFFLISLPELMAQTPKQKSIPVETTVSYSPLSITFSWPAVTGATGFQVFRKTKDSDVWGTAVATLQGTATGFVDNNVTSGSDYEYRIYSTGSVAANTYVWAGIDVPPVEFRGKLILLVDSVFSVPLEPEIERLISDIEGDGWRVIRYDVSRFSTPPAVKAIINAEYNADQQNVKSVFLLGHIPVPYSGLLNPDGHPDHKGAWPADGYYSDFTTNWTDQSVNDTTANRQQNRNVPGDGKFDQSVLSPQLALQTGRVDFFNMPAFTLNEPGLMKQYLDKNHEYRHKIIDPQRRALIDDNFGWFSGEAFSAGAWRNFTAMFPPSDIVAGDYFGDMANDSYLWSYGCGAGSFTNCNGVGNTTAFSSNSPKSVFTMLFGSYFGDWDSQNNLLRAPLASSGWGLACSWSGRPHHVYHHMALGETIGYSIWRTMRNSSTYESGYGAGFVSAALMGDPTLRMHVVAPPSGLTTVFNQTEVNLSWMPSPDSVNGYHVYRLDKTTGIYQQITSPMVNTTSYTDLYPGNGTNHYMVRAVKLETSNSGSYFNQSQGILDSVQTNIGTQHITFKGAENIRIWPNPATDDATITFSLGRQAMVNAVIYDLTGKQVFEISKSTLSAGNHTLNYNVSTLKPGLYLAVVTTGGISSVNKLMVLGSGR